MMEALWVHQWHNQVNEALLDRMLKSSDPSARAAATRVLCYWRDRLADPLTRLQAPWPSIRIRPSASKRCALPASSGEKRP